MAWLEMPSSCLLMVAVAGASSWSPPSSRSSSSSSSSSSPSCSRSSCSSVRLAIVFVAVALVEVRAVGWVSSEERWAVLARTHPITHAHAHTYTPTISPSLLLAASLHPTGKRGATISVVFWFWLGSARGSSGSGVLKTAEVSSARCCCAAARLLLLLLLHHHHQHHRRRRVAVFRSRFPRYRHYSSRTGSPTSSTSSSARTVVFVASVLSDTISVREFAIFRSRRMPPSFSLTLPLHLSLCCFLCPEKKPRHRDRKPSPRHFCDYPRRSPRRVSYNTHPLSRFRWRFTNSACYPEPTRSTFF